VLSPGGRLLAVQSDDGVALLDASSGRELALLPGPIPVGFLPGNELRTSGPAGLQEHVLELSEQDGVLRVRPPRTVVPTAAGDPWGQSRDGRVVALPGHGQGFSIMRLGPSVSPVQPPPLPQDVRSCAVSPDGRWVATGSHNANPEKLTNARVWDSTTGRLVRTFPVSELCVVQFSPAGTWLATSSRVDDECRLWRVGTWEPGPRFARTVHIAFSADDRLLASGGPHGVVVLWEAATGREITRLASREMTALLPQCFSPDRSRLYALGVDNGLLHVWNVHQIHDGLEELGLARGWPEFPPVLSEADPPAPLTVE
jgi:WD40 repeat protein